MPTHIGSENAMTAVESECGLSRTSNVLSKRREQLRRWQESETNQIEAVRRDDIIRKVKFQDRDVFLSACASEDFNEVDQLLSNGADVNTATVDGLTALHQAVIDGKRSTVEFLTDRGADVNAQDNEGWTPLHAAACCGNGQIVQFLCSRDNVDLTITNSDKELALDLVEDDECRAILEKEYSRKGIDCEQCKGMEEQRMMEDIMEWIGTGQIVDRPHPRTGALAIHVAAAKGYIKLLSMLLRAGVDVNSVDRDGWTALHGAAHWAEQRACEILVDHGASFDARSFAGQTPLDVADEDVLPFLEELRMNANEQIPFVDENRNPNSLSMERDHEDQSLLNHRRKDSIARLSTDQKIAIAKKDEALEHDRLAALAESAKRQVDDSNLSPIKDDDKTTVAVKKSKDDVIASQVTSLAVNAAAAQQTVKNEILSPIERRSIHFEPAEINRPWQLDAAKTDPVPNKSQQPLASTGSAQAVVVTQVMPPKRSATGLAELYLPAKASIKPSFTPPQQPAMREESESERKAKSKQQRQARRSTQGVTREQVQGARELAENRKSTDEGEVPKTVTSSIHQSSFDKKRQAFDFTSGTITTNPSPIQYVSKVEGTNGSYMNDALGPCPSTTPSASNMRRKPYAIRSNRRFVISPNNSDKLNEQGDRGPAQSPAISASSSIVKTVFTAPTTVTANYQSNKSTNSTIKLENKTLSGYGNRYPGYGTSFSSSSGAASAQNSSSGNNSQIASSVSSVNSVHEDTIDYKKLYEREKAENDRLRGRIDEVQLRTQKLIDSQAEKLEHLRSDNQRLKEENGALIRVIAKLSK